MEGLQKDPKRGLGFGDRDAGHAALRVCTRSGAAEWREAHAPCLPGLRRSQVWWENQNKGKSPRSFSGEESSGCGWPYNDTLKVIVRYNFQ